MSNHVMTNRPFLLIAVLPALAAMISCGGARRVDEVIATYGAGGHHLYAKSLGSARDMQRAIETFLESPDEETLEAARKAWLAARDDYGPTEAFRFAGGPIDRDGGPEGLINSWPVDEAYIDAVEGAPEAGIVNRVEQFPEISREVLIRANQAGGEENVATGWHAIEFLLWGQDLDPDGPGNRPATDYTTAPNADRRARYLGLVTDLLIEHLELLVAEWEDGRTDNYRAELSTRPHDQVLRSIIDSNGEITRGELAGERLLVAYETRSQEDEHSCFSDNTTADVVANATGILAVLEGDYGQDAERVQGPGLLDLFEEADAELAARLRERAHTTVELAASIPAPFDRHLRSDVPDSDPGRVALLATIESLEEQADLLAAAAATIGIRAGSRP